MRWSVLLPTEARPDSLALTIRGVLAQQDTDLELLVIGAADTSISDPRVHWFDVPGEQAIAVRTALAAASGRYLAFAEEGALWGPLHLSRLGALLDAEFAVASTRPTVLLSSGRVVPVPLDLRDRVVLERFEHGQPLSPTSLAVSMGAVNAAGGWPSGDAPHRALLRRVLAGRGVGIGYSSSTTAVRWVDGSLDEDLDSTWLDGATVVGGSLDAVAKASALRPERWWTQLDEAVGTIEHRLAGQTLELRGSLRGAREVLAAAEDRVAELEAAFRQVPAWRVPSTLREAFGPSASE